MHFGRGDLKTERAHESALISCLRHFEDQIDHLVLLGDVYDQYIEYPNLIPKGIARFQGLLAAWTDRGIPITYLIGNHDPWHIDYYQEELGINVVFDVFTEPLLGKHVYLHHGDGIASRFPLNTVLKRLLQHPIPVYLYRTFLPGDAGYKLARWVNRRIHSDVINEEVTQRLRQHAKSLITEQQYDLVAMGHSHQAELAAFDQGIYLNTGCWRLFRTFACMFSDALTLYKWDDATQSATVLSEASFTREVETSG